MPIVITPHLYLPYSQHPRATRNRRTSRTARRIRTRHTATS